MPRLNKPSVTKPSPTRYGLIICNIIVPLFLLLLSGVIWRLHQVGLGTITTHYTQQLNGYDYCDKIYSPAIGAEDAEVLSYDPPLIFLSAAPHRTCVLPKVEEGGIFLLDLNQNNTVTRVPIKGFDGPFHPHGISVFHSINGKVFLFVVNHQHLKMPDQVLIFQYIDQTLLHVETITDDLLISLNDVVGVGEREFYATNDHGTTRDSLYYVLETLIPFFSKSSVVYWNGSTQQANFAVKPGELTFTNGIAVSRDQRTIYVADSMTGSINIYNRNLQHSESLELFRVIQLHTGPDNINVAEDGSLWIGCHPNFLRFLLHAADNSNSWKAPSQVVKVDLNSEPPVVKQVYLSNGDAQVDVSASSTGIPTKNHLIITPVFEEHFLVCSKR